MHEANCCTYGSTFTPQRRNGIKSFTSLKPKKTSLGINKVRISPIKPQKLFNSESKSSKEIKFERIHCTCGFNYENQDCCSNAYKWLSCLFNRPLNKKDFTDMKAQYEVQILVGAAEIS